MTRVGCALVALASLAACSGNNDLPGDWDATRASGTGAPATVQTQLTISDGSITWQDACGTSSATLKLKDSKLALSTMTTKATQCSAAEQATSGWVTALLLGAPKYSVNGEQLVLTSPDGRSLEFSSR